jgi:hypothetical protein
VGMVSVVRDFSCDFAASGWRMLTTIHKITLNQSASNNQSRTTSRLYLGASVVVGGTCDAAGAVACAGKSFWARTMKG